MPDLNALREAWPEHGSLEAKLALINSMQVPGPTQDIALPAIRARLASRMEHLQTFALAAKTRDVRRRLGMPTVPQSVTSAVYLLQLMSSNELVLGRHRLGVLKDLLSDLVSDETSGIEQSDMDAVLALSSTTMPWWQAHKFSGPVGIYDAIEAQLS
jgi:hypothetical protein